MKLRQIVKSLEDIAPLRYAEPWDNVGLLAGDYDDLVSRVLLTIDMTKDVIREAIDLGCHLVIAYHPPIFDGLKRIDARSPIGMAVRNGIAVYSPHTALDAADGGTNDVLADAVGLLEREPIRASKSADDEPAKPGFGMGRIGPVKPITRGEFIKVVKTKLGLEQVLVAGPEDGKVTKVAVAAGAAGDLLKLAIRQGAHAIVCGELRHHDALAATSAGVTVICARHSCSERQTLKPFGARLRDLHPGVEFLLSERDHDPFRFA